MRRRSSLLITTFLWAGTGCGALSLLLLWQRRGWVALLGTLAVAALLSFLVSRAVADQADYLQRGIDRLPEPVPPVPASEGMRELAEVATALGAASPRLATQMEAAGESGQKLESLLDAMQDAVTAIDAAGRISWVNRAMQGLMRASHGSVRTGYSLVQTVRAPEILECVQLALETRELVERRPVTVLPGHIVEVTAAPMPGGGAVIVMHDITRIEQVERTQREFVANVSHELRTPLTSIQGFVEVLLEELDEGPAQGFAPGLSLGAAAERRREFLEAILKSSRRMGRLTDDLLALARVESGERKVKPEPTLTGALMEECVEAVAGLFKERGTLAIAGEMPDVEVLADPDAILRVLSNLVENALNYGRGPDGWAIVELSAKLLPPPRPEEMASVQFRVRDFGAGIAYEHQLRLFERFYRVDKARSRESGGTGLGLAIVQHIVEAHHGRIWVESELGQGSSFLFTLPCVAFAPEDDPLAPLSSTEAATSVMPMIPVVELPGQ